MQFAMTNGTRLNNNLSDKMEQAKVVIMNDPIHKMVRLHPLWVKIIDTPEFERLRYLKQLGFAFQVYPSATNTRFEHSIGVCHLAYQMVCHLKEQLEGTGDHRITDVDCLCVSVAGLCHDLGHGPFSHTWERFMEKAAPNAGWKHEFASIQIFNRIWKKLDIENDPAFGLGEDERKIICDFITGDTSQPHPKLQGKHFLFEIVANKKSGVDVDKWDYIARDRYYLAVGEKAFQYDRLIQFSQVLVEENDKAICYKDSEHLLVFDMFYIRWRLNRIAYKHRVARIIEGMFLDALLKADDSIFINGKKLSEVVYDLDAYLKLRDSVIDKIQELDEDHPARQLVNRIETRQLYKSVGSCFSPRTDICEKEIEKNIQRDTGLNDQQFYVDIVIFDWGKGPENPVDYVPFYSRNGISKISTVCQASRMLPNEFEEARIMWICRETDPATEKTLRNAFQKWFNRNQKELQLRVECEK